MDFYDVSLVEGNNLPMYINRTGGTTRDEMSADGLTKAARTHDADTPPARHRSKSSGAAS